MRKKMIDRRCGHWPLAMPPIYWPCNTTSFKNRHLHLADTLLHSFLDFLSNFIGLRSPKDHQVKWNVKPCLLETLFIRRCQHKSLEFTAILPPACWPANRLLASTLGSGWDQNLLRLVGQVVSIWNVRLWIIIRRLLSCWEGGSGCKGWIRERERARGSKAEKLHNLFAAAAGPLPMFAFI